MIQYRKAEATELAAFVDFANTIFKVDMEALLPKAFTNKELLQEITTIGADEEKNILAAAATLPQNMTVGKETLRANYLGAVSVHPQQRGKGYMKELVSLVVADMQTQYDISVLSGLRQRYEYFGYTLGGIQYKFELLRSNVQHALKNSSNSSLSFVSLLDLANGLEFAGDLNKQRPIHVERSKENLAEILATYQQTPIGILKEDKLIGYLLWQQEHNCICELALVDTADTQEVIHGIFSTFLPEQESLSVLVPPEEKALNLILSSFAERTVIEESDNYNIFDFANVIKAFLQAKHQRKALSHGSRSFIMADQPVTITVDENGVCVEKTASAEAIHLTKMEAQDLLLRTLTPYKEKYALPDDWFPLPIFWYTADKF